MPNVAKFVVCRHLLCVCLMVVVAAHPYAPIAQAATTADSFLRGVVADGSSAAPIIDCDAKAKSSEGRTSLLNKSCNWRERGGKAYAYPKVEWRSFRPQDITDKFKTWKEQYGKTGGGLYNDLLTSLEDDIEKGWNPKILRSGDVAAANALVSVMNAPAGTKIGDTTITDANRHTFNVHTQQINRVGTAPTIMAFYDQYDGNLYLHAFKLRRSGANHVETLHARLSPLHLDYLQGNSHYIADNAPRNALAKQAFRKFYRSGDPYTFRNIGYDGAIVAAGKMAKLLKSDLVVNFVPTIDITQTKSTKKSLFKKKTTVRTYAKLEPRWMYGFPQFSLAPKLAGKIDPNVGLTSAICAGKYKNGQRCDHKHNIIPSELVMMEASPMSPGMDLQEQQFFSHSVTHKGFRFIAQIILAVVVVFVVALTFLALGPAVGLAVGKTATGGLSSIAALKAGFAGGAAYAAGSYINGARSLGDIQEGFAGRTISDGKIRADLSLAGKGGVSEAISNELQSTALARHNLNNHGIRSVRALYQGVCEDDRQRGEDCRRQVAIDKGLCSADMSAVECRNKLGIAFNAPTGIVPRPDSFVPFAGGEAVAAVFSTDEGRQALNRLASFRKSVGPNTDQNDNSYRCTWTHKDDSHNCTVTKRGNNFYRWRIPTWNGYSAIHNFEFFRDRVNEGVLIFHGGGLDALR